MTERDASSAPARRRGSTLAWAGYLATSWTWVIGLLWPALLVRDFGLAGWLAFAGPNIAGAAAFGFVIARPDVSRRVARTHQALATRFSEVTIAFHVFAAGWALWLLGGMNAAAVAALIALLAAAVGFGYRRGLAAIGLAALAISLGLAVAWLVVAGDEVSYAWTAAIRPSARRLPLSDLAWLSPALALGFLLCPYLDLTFHRARQATTPASGKAAFALGFAGFFLLMIGFSLLYAVPVAILFKTNQPPQPLATAAIGLLVAHIALQAGATTGFHLAEIATRLGHAGLHRVLALAVAAGALTYWALQPGERGLFGFTPAETVYRGFILFYGLVFPAYVWLVMLPTRRAVAHRARLILWLATVVITLPPAFLAFVGERPWLIGPTLAVLLLARLALAILPAESATQARLYNRGIMSTLYRLSTALYYLMLGLWTGSLATFALAAPAIFYRTRLFQPEMTATPPGSPPMQGAPARIIAGDIANHILASLATLQIALAIGLGCIVLLQCSLFRRRLARPVTSRLNLIRLALLALAIIALAVQLNFVSPRMDTLRQRMYHPETPQAERATLHETFDRYHIASERILGGVMLLLVGATVSSPFVLMPRPPRA